MGLNLTKEFKTDKESEVNGIWEDFGDGCEIKIARIGNPNFRKVSTEVRKPYKKQINRGTLSEEKTTNLLIKILAKTIILDWKGLTENDENGKEVEIEYNYANCIRVLTDYPDFREQVVEISTSMEAYKINLDEEEEENL